MPRHGGRSARWDRFRLRILDRDGWRCQRCGKPGNEVDHVKPLKWGGALFDAANCQTLCRSDHIAKTRKEQTKDNPERDAWRAYMRQVVK